MSYTIDMHWDDEEPTVCDRCGAELSQRKDDNIESLTTRLEAYHAQTKPVIEYYEKAGIVKEINADQGIEDVFGDIREVLGGLL